MSNLAIGMQMPAKDWLDLNGDLVFKDPSLSQYVAPFPPQDLMQVVSGLTSERDFAAHGVAIFSALQKASSQPLTSYASILDFGCGCGRLARMFKGHPGQVTGCDIDGRHVDWINGNLSHMKAVRTEPNAALPFPDKKFNAVVSVSVFSHMDERAQRFYLLELERVCDNGAFLFLTTHGERAMERALTETRIFEMLAIDYAELAVTSAKMHAGQFNCIVQEQGHLTSDNYKYGITFIPSTYIHNVWSEYFDVVEILGGAIHDFQDIVVCRKR